MKKETQPLNKYDAMIQNLLNYRKREIRKIKGIGITIAIIGLIVVLYSITNKEYGIYFFFAGLIISSIGTGFGKNKERAINKYVSQQIRTIEDEQTRDQLRKTK